MRSFVGEVIQPKQFLQQVSQPCLGCAISCSLVVRITTEQRLTRSPTLVKTCPHFFIAHVRKYDINTPFWRHIDAILASSPGTFDLKATFSGYESWCFALNYEKAGGQNYRGNLPGWRRWDARGDMCESDFWLISILWYYQHVQFVSQQLFCRKLQRECYEKYS